MNPPQTTTPVVGVLGLIQDGPRLLMIRRAKNVKAPLTWCFPGGHIEDGETEAQALVREMREELHIEVAPGRYLLTETKHSRGLVLHCWSATITAGEPLANPKEVAEFAWLTAEEVRRKEGVLPGTTDILDAMRL
jgi:8-oxo-dGTP diphosphatase